MCFLASRTKLRPDESKRDGRRHWPRSRDCETKWGISETFAFKIWKTLRAPWIGCGVTLLTTAAGKCRPLPRTRRLSRPSSTRHNEHTAMDNEADNVVGTIQLTRTTSLVFSV